MRSSSLPTNAFTAVHASKFLHMGVCVCVPPGLDTVPAAPGETGLRP